jgi:hypothetical protein
MAVHKTWDWNTFLEKSSQAEIYFREYKSGMNWNTFLEKSSEAEIYFREYKSGMSYE